VGDDEPQEQNDGQSVNVEGGKTTKDDKGLVPDPATVTVTVSLVDPCDEGKTTFINNVPVDFYRGKERFACGVTGRNCEDDTVTQAVTRPGLIAVAPPPTITLDGGRMLRLSQKAKILVQADPGANIDVDAVYIPVPGEIQVAAFLTRPSEGKQVNGKPCTIFVPGVTFTLRQENNLIGQFTTSKEQLIARFSDLVCGGSFSLQATVPSGGIMFDGQSYELDQCVKPINVAAGQTVKIFDQIGFRLRTGRVTGVVLDETCGKGLRDVRITIVPLDGCGPAHHVTADANGLFGLDLPPGRYQAVLDESTLKTPDGRTLYPSQGLELQFSVIAGAMTPPLLFRITAADEEHGVKGQVADDVGDPYPYAVVEVLDEQLKLVTQAVADENGYYLIPLETSGSFFLRLQGEKDLVQVQVNSTPTQNLTSRHRGPGSRRAAGPVPPTAAKKQANGKPDAVGDLAAYPILTEQVSFPTPAAPLAAPTPGTAPLGQVVDHALREVLGWRPKARDVKGFLTALTQSFDCRDVEGHVVCTWTPRTYAALVQDDLGAVTGAQASIYARAQVALDQSLPLLDGLYPLTPDILPEDIESIKAIIRSELIQLVNELKIVGGPRVQRVDELFGLLLGPDASNPDRSTDPEQVGGQLRVLRQRLGLERSRVNTIDDEQNLTNFLILVDYVNTLDTSWLNERKFFTRATNNGEPFLGTQLVLIARSLTAVAEGVQDVYFTMDSVFIGPAERQTIELLYPSTPSIEMLPVPGDPDAPNQTAYQFSFPANTPSLFVSELLDWVARASSEEGPALLRDAGKDGVIAFFPTIDKLRKLVRGALIVPDGLQNPQTQPLPAGYSSGRVQRALQELADQLDETAGLAGQIEARELVSRGDITAQTVLDAFDDPAVVARIVGKLSPGIRDTITSALKGQMSQP
jgi:hypothetical protein